MADMNKRGASDCDDCDDCESGERGERGKRGHRGHRGHDGHDGHDGTTGPTGTSDGPTGPTGAAGTLGPTGPIGTTGDVGPTGPGGGVPTTEHLTGSGGDPAIPLTNVDTSFLTNATSESVLNFTLADGLLDGQIHDIVNDAASSSAIIVITPANFRDGTTITSTAGAASCALIWNAVGGEWHMLGTPRNFTIG